MAARSKDPSDVYSTLQNWRADFADAGLTPQDLLEPSLETRSIEVLDRLIHEKLTASALGLATLCLGS